jgi:hypothetical protein
MTEDNKYELDDLVTATVDRKPVEFEQAFSDLMIDRIRTAVEDKKLQIAQQMYGYEPPEEFDTDENDDEFGASDVEIEEPEEE